MTHLDYNNSKAGTGKLAYSGVHRKKAHRFLPFSRRLPEKGGY